MHILRVSLIILCLCASLEAQDKPPRFEIGAVLSSAKQLRSDSPQYLVFGGGARLTINATKYLAVEAESTHQPTATQQPDVGPYYSGDTHTDIALKVTYRAEQRRWLKFAGLNFFGVIGPAFLNRPVVVAAPNPPPFCFECSVMRRQTAAMLDVGAGFEVVPVRALALRFDVTHGSFSEVPLFSSFSETESITYVKVALMLRLH
jgi:hypothetical protein